MTLEQDVNIEVQLLRAVYRVAHLRLPPRGRLLCFTPSGNAFDFSTASHLHRHQPVRLQQLPLLSTVDGKKPCSFFSQLLCFLHDRAHHTRAPWLLFVLICAGAFAMPLKTRLSALPRLVIRIAISAGIRHSPHVFQGRARDGARWSYC